MLRTTPGASAPPPSSRMGLKKLASALLALAMAVSLFSAIPLTARAATNRSVTLGSSLSTNQTNIQNAINASSSGDTVTVTGSVTDTVDTLNLNIKAGVTVNWSAQYTSSSSNAKVMIALSGSGTFNVTGSIKNAGAGNAIDSKDINVMEVKSGGSVTSNRYAIYSSAKTTVIVSGGRVSSSAPVNSSGLSFSTIRIEKGGTIAECNDGINLSLQ